MNVDKNAMALFVKVVENNSFSKAARREGVPVSTVSRKIIETHRGKLEIITPKTGQAGVVRISLPLELSKTSAS